MATFKHIILALASLSAVAAQSCGVTGTSETTITIAAIDETIPVGEIIWSGATFNVAATAAVSHPHAKYINGLRYPSKYEYVSNAITADFVQTERNASIRRDVIFTCADGTTMPYTFIFEFNDENTEAPMFADKNYSAVFSKSSSSADPVSANVIVNDSDFEQENAQLVLRSSNPYVTPFVQPLWEGQHPNPYSYQMDFIVSKDLEVGEYRITLTADDGKSSDFAILNLSVLA